MTSDTLAWTSDTLAWTSDTGSWTSDTGSWTSDGQTGTSDGQTGTSDGQLATSDGKSAVHYGVLFVDVYSWAHRTMGERIHVSRGPNNPIFSILYINHGMCMSRISGCHGSQDVMDLSISQFISVYLS